MKTEFQTKLKQLFNQEKDLMINDVNELVIAHLSSISKIREYIDNSNDESLHILTDIDDKKMLEKTLLSLAYTSIFEYTYSAFRDTYNEKKEHICIELGLNLNSIKDLGSHESELLNLLV
jgi:hypothetical protein